MADNIIDRKFLKRLLTKIISEILDLGCRMSKNSLPKQPFTFNTIAKDFSSKSRKELRV